jgi:hypothetical protein
VIRTLLVVVLASVGCTSPTPSFEPQRSAPQRSAPPSPEPPSATARTSDFELTFHLPRSIWRTSDSIEGEAVLSLLDPELATISGSGSGPMAFRFTADGVVVDPVRPASCERMAVSVDAPIRSGIVRSGVASPDDGRHPFGADWFRDPELHLPPGNWRIEAIAEFHIGPDCQGPAQILSAGVDLTVVD